MARRPTAPGATSRPAVLFGAELRHAREAAGHSQAELATLLHCDRSLVTRIEAGERVPQQDFATRADQVLRTDGLLLRIWSRIDWYAQVEHPDWFRRFAEMEARAVAIRAFQVSRIYGLLQTEDYARALFAGDTEAFSEALIEDRVAARMSRQQRFLADGAPMLLVVLDESAIRSRVGGPSVMRGQLQHLLTVARRPNVILQVSSFDRRRATPPTTSMTLVTLPGSDEWVYSESLDRGHFSDDPSLILRHQRTYDVLRAEALSTYDSAALITSVLEGYDDDRARSPHRSMAQEQLQRVERRRVHRGGPRIPRPRPRPRQ